MSKRGPIIIFEDDKDDVEILEVIFKRLNIPNKLLFFDDGEKLLHYLKTTSEQPFLIISDVNIPKINGLQLRQMISENEYLRKKSVPFIFLSTGAARTAVNKAYELTVQGFFVKKDSMAEIEKQLKLIVDYWSYCMHPNSDGA